MKAKKFYKSRTFWVELLEALIGLAGAVVLFLQEGGTELALTSLAVGLKGVYGVYLRFNTNQAISL